MMTLLVALDYKKVTPSSEVGMGEGKDDNAFRYFVSKLVSHPPLGGIPATAGIVSCRMDTWDTRL